MPITKMNKSIISMFLTGVLLVVAIGLLSFSEMTQGATLWIDVLFLTLLNVGFIVSLVIGVKAENKSFVIFSVLVNSALLLIGFLMIFIYIFVAIMI